MVDVGEKPSVRRQAEAAGEIFLSPGTIRAIQGGGIKKGDPFLVAEIAGISAAKQTHLLIPHCHQIPLDTAGVRFRLSETCVEAQCFVKAQARTGVEMEALAGVCMALCTLWDMVKYLEKDDRGQYPSTRISNIRVLSKEKADRG